VKKISYQPRKDPPPPPPPPLPDGFSMEKVIEKVGEPNNPCASDRMIRDGVAYSMKTKGFTYPQIAEFFGIALSTAKLWVKRSRKRSLEDP